MKKSLIALVAVAALAFPASAFAQSDLSVAKSDSADPVTVGSQFEYTVTVANAGPEAATAVSLADTLPNEVDFVSATASQGICELQGSKRVNCELGTIAAGANATATLRVIAARAGTAVNTATVSGTPADPVEANNEVTEQTVIQAAAPVMCAGRQATLFGTTGADTLSGTDKTDVIAGLGGDDTIRGLDGRDVICAGRGVDVVVAGGDGDVVKGGADTDRIRGSGGDDVLAGNGADDRLRGGSGDDALRGGSGDDDCRGGRGKDVEKGC
jgi:uncharacterized repeat protein (TIGR01451 family)